MEVWENTRIYPTEVTLTSPGNVSFEAMRLRQKKFSQAWEGDHLLEVARSGGVF